MEIHATKPGCDGDCSRHPILQGQRPIKAKVKPSFLNVQGNTIRKFDGSSSQRAPLVLMKMPQPTEDHRVCCHSTLGRCRIAAASSSASSFLKMILKNVDVFGYGVR